MSKIFRNTFKAPSVFIGERHRDFEFEKLSEQNLAKYFPAVEFLIEPDGSKLIPITEVPKFLHILERDKAEQGQQSYTEGYQAGKEEGLVEARRVLEQFEGAISDVVGQRQSLLDESKSRILDLVIQISKKVTFDAIEIDRDATVTMISNIIEELVDRSRLRIRVNPDFLPIVEQQRDRFLGSSTTIKDLTFEADPRVKMGGCFIETPSGDVDARIESQFEVVAGILTDDGGEK